MKWPWTKTSKVPTSIVPKHQNHLVKYRNGFMASAVNRLTQSWYSQLQGPNSTIQTDAPRLRGLSRYLANNDVYTARYLSLVETRVVGPDGLIFQPRVLNRKGDLDNKINAELVAKWDAWGEIAGIAGESFLDLQQTLIRTVAQDGEVFIRLITDESVNVFGLALQILDADLLDHQYTNALSANGNTIVQGIEVDALGRRVAYHFWNRHPTDYRTSVPLERIRVEADEILHLYRPTRAGQLRGLPWITPAMYFLARLHEYMDAELVSAQAAASQVATIETDASDSTAYTSDMMQREIIEIEPGVAIRLAPGERMTPWDQAKSTDAFDPYTKIILHGVASALNVSYSTLASDMSEDNYSSARMSGNYEQKHFDNLQAWFPRVFHQKVYRTWLSTASAMGTLDIPSFDATLLMDVVFRGMKLPSPDLLKDLRAAEVGFKNNVISKTQWCAQQGYDYQDVLNDRYEEEKLEREYEAFLKEQGLEPVSIQNAEAVANEEDE